MKRIAAALGCLLLCGAGSPDWKLYALPKAAADRSDAWFYDSAGIRPLSNKHLQVWTEGIFRSVLDSDKMPDAGVTRAGQRVLRGYEPPIKAIIPMQDAMADAVVIMEEQADENRLTAHDQVLWEIDCANATESVVTAIATDAKGGTRSAEVSTAEWDHMPPGSSGDNLMKLVCK